MIYLRDDEIIFIYKVHTVSRYKLGYEVLWVGCLIGKRQTSSALHRRSNFTDLPMDGMR